ncbi:MAG: DNA-directed RNA polymerase subunit N [Candidatus Poseidoniales archaeon]|nr:DNA-directed RNA polymerase subunit N [Euryarchaeota archaeon]RJU93043.1 MAG: DNA-directed RNA polymerase subunit N [Candidatus Poseidoniales archaeon]|tara:strand:+ start:469 stop:672 length:204 start_codon:yes stop_codon:yes gene_type:complete
MIIPVRCFSCGAVIAHKWEEFNELTSAGVEMGEALDKIGLKRYCCRRMYVGHIDLIYETAPFSTAIQ